MLSLAEARVAIEDYRSHYNEERPHGGIGYRTPVPARIEAQALGSSRPPGSLRQELDPNPTAATSMLNRTCHSFRTRLGGLDHCKIELFSIAFFVLLGNSAFSESIEVSQLQDLANKGDLKAETDLGWAFLNGMGGVAVDKDRGFQLLKQAAENGFSKAQYDLGYAYEVGVGTVIDFGQAFSWYQKAAQEGSSEAAQRLAVIYSRGSLGQNIDLVESRKWIQMAAGENLPSAQAALAAYYYGGIGGPKDSSQAFAWDMRAAMAGNAHAQYAIAYNYSRGQDGAPKNTAAAWEWNYIAAMNNGLSGSDIKGNDLLREELTGQMTDEEIGAATRQVMAYLNIIQKGGAALLPNLVGKTSIEFNDSEEQNAFEIIENHVVLPVLINGQGPFNFVLDTGSSASLIDGKLAAQLKLPSIEKIPSLPPDANAVRDVYEASCSVFKNEIKQEQFVVEPMDSISHAFGKVISGFLGYDFISHFVIEINYQTKNLRLFNPKSYQYNGSGQVMPISLAAGLPWIEASLGFVGHDPVKTWLVVDTGSYGLVDLDKDFDREHRFFNLAPNAVSSSFESMGGTVHTIRAVIPFLSIGIFQMSNPMVECQQDDRVERSSIGGEALRRFNIIVDYKSNRMILEPNAQFNEPFNLRWFGLAVFAEGDDFKTFRVGDLEAHSPADAAGFLKGDVITACDGVLSTNLTLESLRELIKSRDDHVLTVQRGEAVVELKLQAKILDADVKAQE